MREEEGVNANVSPMHIHSLCQVCKVDLNSIRKIMAAPVLLEFSNYLVHLSLSPVNFYKHKMLKSFIQFKPCCT